MAIKTEKLESGLIRTYSDRGVMIQQHGTGIEYCEAVDPADSGRTYAETKTPIPTPEPLDA